MPSKNWLLLLTASFLCACSAAPDFQKVVPRQLESRDLVDRDYTIGTEKTCAVGDPMIRVKSYTAVTTQYQMLRAENSFTFGGGGSIGFEFEFEEGAYYPVIGVTIDGEGETRYAFQLDHLIGTVDSDGHLQPEVYNNGTEIVWSFATSRKDARLVHELRDETIQIQGLSNYEILFSGVANNTISLTYREYTKEDLARPAFSQTAQYASDASLIRFKNVRLQVHEATSETIRFSVLSDSAGN